MKISKRHVSSCILLYIVDGYSYVSKITPRKSLSQRYCMAMYPKNEVLSLLTCLVLHILLRSLGGGVKNLWMNVCVCFFFWGGIGLWHNSKISLLISIAPIALIASVLKIGAQGRRKHSVFVVVTKHGYLNALTTFLSWRSFSQNFVQSKYDNCTFDTLL